MPEFAGRATQHPSIPSSAQVMDPSHAPSVSGCSIGNCLHLQRQTPKHSTIRQQLQNTTVLQPRHAEEWKRSLESSCCQWATWAWISYAHAKHRPRAKTKHNALRLSNWQWTPLRKRSENYEYLGPLKQRSNAYVYYVKNTHGVRSLSRTHSAIIISQVKTHQTMPIQSNSSSTVEC